MQRLDQEISNRISLLRYPLILGIVFTHVPVSLGQPYLFELTKAFLADGVFRAGVPLLSVISGYLLFRSGLEKHYRALIAKKFHSLVVPLVLWNLSLLIILYLLQSNDRWTPEFPTVYPFDPMLWIDRVFGVRLFPANFQMYFLRDLFVLNLLAPLYGICLRRAPWLGLLGVLFVFGSGLADQLVTRGDIAINFYVGGMAAVREWDVRRLDAHAVPLFVVFLIASALAAAAPDPVENYPFWFRIASPWVLWPLSALAIHSSVGKTLMSWSEYSFFLFLSHWAILRLLWRVYMEVDTSPFPFYPVFWFVAPIGAALIATQSYDLLRRAAPRLLDITVGRRATTK